MSVFNCNYVQTRQQSWTFYGNARWFFYKSLVSKRWVMWKNWSCVGSYFKIPFIQQLFCLVAADPKNWQNNSLPGDPNYLVGANCVSVLIDHFWGRTLLNVKKMDTLTAQHTFMYEDPVSSVYCTWWWRQDSNDRHKLLFKRIPLIWNLKKINVK